MFGEFSNVHSHPTNILWFCKLRGFANQFTFAVKGCFRVPGALLPVLIGLWLVHSSLQAGETRVGTF